MHYLILLFHRESSRNYIMFNYFHTFLYMLWLWLLQLFVDINCAYFGGSPDGEATKRGIIYKKILTYVRR
jgi:hypothetical protein